MDNLIEEQIVLAYLTSRLRLLFGTKPTRVPMTVVVDLLELQQGLRKPHPSRRVSLRCIDHLMS